MKRTYESMVLLDNREVRKGWQPLKELVCGLFTKHGAEIKSSKRWDERRLAYPIDRQLRGTYLLIYFEADTNTHGSIRRELEFSDLVLRHLTLAVAEIPATAFEPETAFDETQVRVEDVSMRRDATPEREPRGGAGAAAAPAAAEAVEAEVAGDEDAAPVDATKE